MKRNTNQPRKADLPVTFKLAHDIVRKLDDESKRQRRTKKALVEIALLALFSTQPNGQ